MYYKNTSHTAKTFYGVTFMPEEIREVPGYVNDRCMILSTPIKESKEQQKLSPATPPKAEKKPEVKHEEKKEVKPETPKKPVEVEEEVVENTDEITQPEAEPIQ